MRKLKDEPFVLFGVNTITPDAKKLAQVMAKEQLPWRSLARRDAINEQWNNPGTPSYYVIDHRGVIRHKWVGNPGEATIDAALATLLDERSGGAGKAARDR
ncbi:MAG TPA: hypothetical protein VFZ65_08920 [Planctomycetota bacterium]|nr:hypothetical protein [Planctomycetota bacterium]